MVRLSGVMIAVPLLVNCGGGGLTPGITQPTTSPTPPTVNHHVDLHWAASASQVSGYNIFRGTQSGGPYECLNSSPIPTPAYTDKSVSSGLTYYYVTTAVDSTGVESVRSNETVAVIPTP
jgi:fibronectin type 3 domain-containing protein